MSDINKHKDKSFSVANAVAHLSGEEFLKAFVQSAAQFLGVKYLFVGQPSDDPNRIQAIAFWSDDGFIEGYEYPLRHSPCENVFGHETCVYLSGVQDQFPLDKDLQDFGVEGYVGTPLFARNGTSLGLLIALDDKAIHSEEDVRSLFEFYSKRVGTELEVYHADKLLDQSEGWTRSILEHSPISVAIAEPDGTIIRCNDAFALMLGLSKSQILGKNIMEFTAPSDVEASREAIQSVISGVKSKVRLEKRYVASKGEIIWGDLSLSVVRDSEGEVSHLIGMILDITERKRSEKQLEDSLEASSEGFALFDPDDRLVICNRVYRDFYKTHAGAIQIGRTLEEILRAGLAAGAFPQAMGNEDAWLAERLRQHQATETIEQQLADGRWLMISERRTSDGGIVGVRTDITALKEREHDLRRSELRFQNFTETASDWIWETDRKHRFTFIGGGAIIDVRQDGRALAVGRTRHECAAEDTDNDKWRDHQADLDAHKSFKDFRYWVRRPGAEERLITVSGIPVFDEDGTFQGYRGSSRDITDEHRKIDRIVELEERFRIGFESITIGIVLADKRGRIIAFNPAASSIFGYTENEIIGQNVRVLANDRDSEWHDDYMRAYDTTGVPMIIGNPRELIGRRKNGEEFPLILGIASMTAGGQQQYIASIADVSSEKRLETQLRQSQKMEAVGQLVGGICHDFNNLLGIIVGNLDLMSRKVDPDSKMAGQLSKALGAADRGATLTRRLLNFSRQDSVDAETIDVHETLTQLLELIQKSITQTIPISLRLNSRMPRIAAERGDLEDAVVNLCINARDAMPDGGYIVIETSDITVTESEAGVLKNMPAGRYLVLDISDTGTGMSPEAIEKIFEPFYTTKEKGKGTGLGLSMVYGFVKRVGGTISVYSEEGVGTTFKLFIPVSEDALGERAEMQEHDGQKTLGGNETVLIVDDEEEMAEIAETVLSDLGYRTLVAHSGAEALKTIEDRDDIDLLFSDVIMPEGMDGFALVEAARKQRPDIAVCLSSGFSGRTQSSEHELEDIPFLKKPYSNEQLARIVREVLDEQ